MVTEAECALLSAYANKDGGIVFDAEAHIGIHIKRLISGLLQNGRFEGDRLITVGLGEFDAAIVVPVIDIPAPEDNQSRFDLFLVDDEAHMFPAHATPQGGALFCAESV